GGGFCLLLTPAVSTGFLGGSRAGRIPAVPCAGTVPSTATRCTADRYAIRSSPDQQGGGILEAFPPRVADPAGTGSARRTPAPRGGPILALAHHSRSSQ